MMEQRGRFVELGEKDVGTLLLQYSWPAIVAMIAASLYNMVDSIFIGHGVGALALSGLAASFPMMNLSAAFGSLVGSGAATLTSICLGQKNYDRALKVFGNVILLNLIVGVVFMAVLLIFLEPTLYFFGASDATIGYASDYMRIILLGNVVTHMYHGLNAILRSSGHPRLAMNATIASVIINTILDPIFIFGLKMGIKGAAIATVIAQVVALLFQIWKFTDKEELLHFRRGIYKLNKRIVIDIFSIGLSPFLINLAACLVVILINYGLKNHGGDLAIGAYGIINRFSFLFLMTVFGLNQGMQPIAGYNFGAKRNDRVLEVLKKTIIAATLVTTVGFCCGELFPRTVVSIFTSDEELINIASEGLRIVVLFFPIVGFQIVSGTFFQSIGKVKRAIFLSLTRQVLFLIPLLLILPNFFGTKGVWWSIAMADFSSSIVALVLLIGQIRLLLKDKTGQKPENFEHTVELKNVSNG
jgi:putative MATE family efflux protein